MTDFDDRLENKAYNLVQQKGKDVVFTVTSSPTVNAEQSSVSGTDTEYTVKVTPPRAPKSKYEVSLVEGADTIIGIPSKNLDFIPAKGQKVTIDSQVWSVVAVIKRYAQDRVVFYEAFLESNE